MSQTLNNLQPLNQISSNRPERFTTTSSEINKLYDDLQKFIIYIPWESRYGQRIDLRVSVNFAVTDRTLPPPEAEVAVI